MQVVLDKMFGKWSAFVDGQGPFEVTAAPNVDARQAVDIVRKGNPEALVGVKSSVFGPFTMAYFGDIVWMRK